MNCRASAKLFRRLALAAALGSGLTACASAYNKAGPIHGLDDRFCEEGFRTGPDFFDPNCYGGIGL